MNPVKRLFGIAPTPDETGRGYIPSPLGRLFGVAEKSGYEPVDFARRTSDGPHPYAGYAMAAFPDSLDQRSPSLGYLPGDLPWLQCEQLEAQRIRIVNDKANGTTHIDRKLYSGDSPEACDQLGKNVAEALLADTATTTQRTAATDESTRRGVR